VSARVVVDCDPGHDDAIALLLALASPDIELVGVTTVAGNQTVAKSTANAIRVLAAVGRDDVPVASGASRPLMRAAAAVAHGHGESGLDGPELPPARRAPDARHAVDFIAGAADTAPLTLVAIGPLTNVALLLARHPEAAEGIERIVLMGGAIAEGNVTPAAEFNVWADPEAAARVFDSGLDVTMVGLDVTHRALVLDEHREALRTASAAGRLSAELLDFYGVFHREVFGFPGSPIHDAVAVAHVVAPGLVETARHHVAVDCQSELCRGRTVVDVWRRTANEPNVHVAVGIDADAFRELLIARLGALP
jgi:inosine-uridine nucleoside N-ribohydrolase